MVKEKTKFFKQKMLKSSQKYLEESAAEKTLKHSKSAEDMNFLNTGKSKGNTTQTFYKHLPSSKQDAVEEIEERT